MIDAFMFTGIVFFSLGSLYYLFILIALVIGWINE